LFRGRKQQVHISFSTVAKLEIGKKKKKRGD
jgi:hypothetical protein